VSEPVFLRACRGEVVDHVPVWFMRQAGRSLPEYRALRGEGSILDAIADPELACEVTLQPVRRYGVDAAILFSDIVVPVSRHRVRRRRGARGWDRSSSRPFESAADLDRLRGARSRDRHRLCPRAPIRIVTDVLAPLERSPLIGFAGAPFTVASYLDRRAGRPEGVRPSPRALMTRRPRLCGPGCSTASADHGHLASLRVPGGARAPPPSSSSTAGPEP
jgi:uroporphyrinogen decarboxylase